MNLKEATPHLTTGFSALDSAVGAGGLPLRRLSTFTGPWAAVNRSMAYATVAAVQREGGVAAYLDGALELDLDFAAAQGVIVRELLVSQPACQEDALEIAVHLLRSGAVDLIVLDDVDLLPGNWRGAALKRKFAELCIKARYSPSATLLLRSTKTPSGFSNAVRYYSSLICGVVDVGQGAALVKVLKDCAPSDLRHPEVRLELAR